MTSLMVRVFVKNMHNYNNNSRKWESNLQTTQVKYMKVRDRCPCPSHQSAVIHTPTIDRTPFDWLYIWLLYLHLSICLFLFLLHRSSKLHHHQLPLLLPNSIIQFNYQFTNKRNKTWKILELRSAFVESMDHSTQCMHCKPIFVGWFWILLKSRIKNENFSYFFAANKQFETLYKKTEF